ncbi:His-Xaa-Ser system protein HxsD [Alistipes ihumii]|uniref:His-Xaa-Ser system protein HxsD n=1 Tax=Alistipes ihumii TaxID=1470347 RepID=UPI002353386A|nr:His-Xaa-Ser system protein HxsD [Alistipes ihumii]
MTDIQLDSRGRVVLSVDLSIYDEHIVDKTLYRWSGDFVITRINCPNTTLQTITFAASEPISPNTFKAMARKLSDDFIDYKNRAIIESETRDLRSILYAKAFANSDDFVEFKFDK